MPSFVVLIPAAARLIASVRPRLVKTLVMVAIVCTSVYAVMPPTLWSAARCHYLATQNDRFASATDPAGVIFLLDSTHDKAIFPERRVGLAEELPEESRHEVLSDIMVKLTEMGVPAYLLAEKGSGEYVLSEHEEIEHEEIEEQLAVKGYALTETDRAHLYQVAAKG
jgi:hypothetical protein